MNYLSYARCSLSLRHQKKTRKTLTVNKIETLKRWFTENRALFVYTYKRISSAVISIMALPSKHMTAAPVLKCVFTKAPIHHLKASRTCKLHSPRQLH